MSDWRKKLTAAERSHLRDTGARSIAALSRNREHQQKSNPDGCFECRKIAQKLGMES